MRFGNAELVGRPMDFGDDGVWEDLLDFSGSIDADAIMWLGVVRRLS